MTSATGYPDLVVLCQSSSGLRNLYDLLRKDPTLTMILHMLGLTPRPRMRRWSCRNYGAFGKEDQQPKKMAKRGLLVCYMTDHAFDWYAVTAEGTKWAGVTSRIRATDRR